MPVSPYLFSCGAASLFNKLTYFILIFSTESMPKCTHISSLYKSFDIARNILYTVLFIVNCNWVMSISWVYTRSRDVCHIPIRLPAGARIVTKDVGPIRRIQKSVQFLLRVTVDGHVVNYRPSRWPSFVWSTSSTVDNLCWQHQHRALA